MKEFTINGKTWKINLTLGAVKRVKDALGVDLLNPSGSDEKEPPVYSRLLYDDLFLAQVVSVLISDQFAGNNETAESFLESLDGAATLQISDAFVEEYSSFFTARGRDYLTKIIEIQKTTLSNAGEEVARSIQESVGAIFANSPVAQDLQTGAN